MFVVEYSPSQCSFHVSSLQEAAAHNLCTTLQTCKRDFIIIACGLLEEHAQYKCRMLQDARRRHGGSLTVRAIRETQDKLNQEGLSLTRLYRRE